MEGKADGWIAVGYTPNQGMVSFMCVCVCVCVVGGEGVGGGVCGRRGGWEAWGVPPESCPHVGVSPESYPHVGMPPESYPHVGVPP